MINKNNNYYYKLSVSLALVFPTAQGYRFLERRHAAVSFPPPSTDIPSCVSVVATFPRTPLTPPQLQNSDHTHQRHPAPPLKKVILAVHTLSSMKWARLTTCVAWSSSSSFAFKPSTVSVILIPVRSLFAWARPCDYCSIQSIIITLIIILYTAHVALRNNSVSRPAGEIVVRTDLCKLRWVKQFMFCCERGLMSQQYSQVVM